jgi:iron complex outermembrane receptor protein
MFYQSEWGIKIMKFKKIAMHLALAGIGAGACNVAAAQDNNVDGTGPIEEVVVTGSRIKQTEANSASPVTIIGAEAIFDSGISNVEDILQEMTASAGPAGRYRPL